MIKINLGKSGLSVPSIALGCMRIGDMSEKDLDNLIATCVLEGINFFDHADIYGGGVCEEVFGKSVKRLKLKREDIIIQSKAGIRSGFFDFSKEHILSAADGILKRLGTDYLDVLLLHRPDALMEPEEIAEAFDILKSSGKVRNFGVSNQNPGQMELLRRYMKMPIIANQLQLSVTHTGMIDAGLTVNMKVDNGVNRDGGVLDYCRLNGITVQAWSPLQHGFFEGTFIDNVKFTNLNIALKEIGKKYGITPAAASVAWILRHPAKMQVIIGSTNVTRVKEIAKSADVTMTRREWYGIYTSVPNILP